MSKIKQFLRFLLKAIVLVVGLPLCLVVLLAAVLYIPQVQDAAVRYVAQELSASTQLQIDVARVRLSFPLTLVVEGVSVRDAEATLLDAGSLELDVALLPLFGGRVDVEQFALKQISLDTQSMVPDVHVRGTLGMLAAQSRGVDFVEQLVNLDFVELADAQFYVVLADTSAPDTSASVPLDWKLVMPRLTVSNVAVSLSMSADSLLGFARVGSASLKAAALDLGAAHYSVEQLSLSRSSAALSATLDSATTAEEQFANFLQHRSSAGVHTGFAYFVDSLGLSIDSVDYRADGTLFAKLCDATLREQQGFVLSDIAATCYMDSAQVSVPAALVATPHSILAASCSLPFSALTPTGEDLLRLRMDGYVGSEDVAVADRMFQLGVAQKYFPTGELQFIADVVGNMEWLELKRMDITLPNMVELKSVGAVAHLLSDSAAGKTQQMEVGMDFELRTGNLTPLLARLGVADTTLSIPQGTSAQGTFDLRGAQCDLALALTAADGFMTAEAAANLDSESYEAHLNFDRLAVQTFMPLVDMRPVVAHLDASGKGFNPMHPKAEMNVVLATDSLNYGAIDLGGMRLNAQLAQQLLNADFKANTTGIVGEGRVQAALYEGYDLNLNMIFEKLSLKQLAGAEKDIDIGTSLAINATTAPDFSDIEVEGNLCSNYFQMPEQSVMMKDIFFGCATNADTTMTFVEAGNLSLQFGGRGFLSDVAQSIDPLAAYILQSIEQLHINHDTVKTLSPSIRLKMDAGNDNPLTNILRAMGYELDTMAIDLRSTPQEGINGAMFINKLKFGKLLLDEVRADIEHGKRGIVVKSSVHNYTRKNPNKFLFESRAFLLEESVGADVSFKDKDGKVGFNVGLLSKIMDGGLQLRLYPERPVIAFRNFEINKDNYIRLDRDRRFSANVRLEADDLTGFQLYGEPSDSVNDITLSLSHLNLRELSNVLPYMPKISGLLNADLHVTDDHQNLAAMGSVQASDFAFEDVKLGNLGADLVYLPKSADEHYASAFITSEGTDVMELNGTYLNEGDGWFEGEAMLNSFPLAIVNGFMQGTDIYLKGTAEGQLNVAGPVAAPDVNGRLTFGDAHIYSNVYSFDFAMDEKPILFENSCMNIDNFRLTTKGKEPLTLNGVLDMSDLDAVRMDFSLKGKNFELINAKRQLASVAFGKLFVDVDCTMKGTTDNLVVRGDLNVLNRTNLTYILKDSPLTVENQLDGLVEFVDFELDETEQTADVLPEARIDVTLGLGISEAANFHCNLSEDGKSYVDIQGGGNLTLRMTKQGEMRLIGRMTIEDGEMKYALPVIPMKTFDLQQGSYIEFTGDVMNPRLSIQATERMKALVTEDDKQRSVAFDVGVAISKTLEDMGFEFTIEAPEDLSIQNQLATMTAAQRSKTAVSLMATGLFIAEGNMATGGFQASSALNAFLQSEIQSIAGSALQTVDINFGVENSTTTSGATTTDYSFQFSKRFFGDRFAINVGGRVSTGAEADNSAASIIDNVTLEYRLDKGATRYVQVFYDRSSFDPLEGQLSKMGGGVVLRKKTSKLGELFIFR